MRATVVMQDRTVWLSGGGPLLCFLLVSGAVRKRRSPEPIGHFKYDAGDTMGGNGGSAREAAEGTGSGHGSDNAGGGGDDKRYEDDGRDVGRDDDDGATERRSQGGTAPAVNTPAPYNPTGLAGDACCECGHTSSCKTARCGCRVARRSCVS